MSLATHKGTASLAELYGTIQGHPRAKQRKHWKAKIRQVLEQSDEFIRVGHGVWSFTSKHRPKTIKKLKALRRKLYPRFAESKR